MSNSFKTASKTITSTIVGEHTHTIVGYSLIKGIGDGEPIASDRFIVGGHEWVTLFYPDGKRSASEGILAGATEDALPLSHQAAMLIIHGQGQGGGLGADPHTGSPQGQISSGNPVAAGVAMASGVAGAGQLNSVSAHLFTPAMVPRQQRRDSSSEYAAVFVALIGEGPNPQGVVNTAEGKVVRAFHKFTLVDQSGRGRDLSKGRVREAGAVKISCARQDPNARNCHGYRKFVKRSLLEDPERGYLAKDTIVIKYTIELVVSTGGALIRSSTAAGAASRAELLLPGQPQSLAADMTRLFETGEGADVTIVADGEEMKAHKVVLEARSSVFRSMLNSRMREGREGRVVVPDTPAAVFKALLHFMYTDALPDSMAGQNLVEMAQHLLAAADRYDLRRLRSVCELGLCELVDVESAAHSLALAEQSRAMELKKVCLDFISRNLAHVMATEGYAHMSTSCPSLQRDILNTVAEITSGSTLNGSNNNNVGVVSSGNNGGNGNGNGTSSGAVVAVNNAQVQAAGGTFPSVFGVGGLGGLFSGSVQPSTGPAAMQQQQLQLYQQPQQQPQPHATGTSGMGTGGGLGGLIQLGSAAAGTATNISGHSALHAVGGGGQWGHADAIEGVPAGVVLPSVSEAAGLRGTYRSFGGHIHNVAAGAGNMGSSATGVTSPAGSPGLLVTGGGAASSLGGSRSPAAAAAAGSTNVSAGNVVLVEAANGLLPSSISAPSGLGSVGVLATHLNTHSSGNNLPANATNSLILSANHFLSGIANSGLLRLAEPRPASSSINAATAAGAASIRRHRQRQSAREVAMREVFAAIHATLPRAAVASGGVHPQLDPSLAEQQRGDVEGAIGAEARRTGVTNIHTTRVESGNNSDNGEESPRNRTGGDVVMDAEEAISPSGSVSGRISGSVNMNVSGDETGMTSAELRAGTGMGRHELHGHSVSGVARSSAATAAAAAAEVVVQNIISAGSSSGGSGGAAALGNGEDIHSAASPSGSAAVFRASGTAMEDDTNDDDSDVASSNRSDDDDNLVVDSEHRVDGALMDRRRLPVANDEDEDEEESNQGDRITEPAAMSGGGAAHKDANASSRARVGGCSGREIPRSSFRGIAASSASGALPHPSRHEAYSVLNQRERHRRLLLACQLQRQQQAAEAAQPSASPSRQRVVSVSHEQLCLRFQQQQQQLQQQQQQLLSGAIKREVDYETGSGSVPSSSSPALRRRTITFPSTAERAAAAASYVLSLEPRSCQQISDLGACKRTYAAVAAGVMRGREFAEDPGDDSNSTSRRVRVRVSDHAGREIVRAVKQEVRFDEAILTRETRRGGDGLEEGGQGVERDCIGGSVGGAAIAGGSKQEQEDSVSPKGSDLEQD